MTATRRSARGKATTSDAVVADNSGPAHASTSANAAKTTTEELPAPSTRGRGRGKKVAEATATLAKNTKTSTRASKASVLEKVEEKPAEKKTKVTKTAAAKPKKAPTKKAKVDLAPIAEDIFSMPLATEVVETPKMPSRATRSRKTEPNGDDSVAAFPEVLVALVARPSRRGRKAAVSAVEPVDIVEIPQNTEDTTLAEEAGDVPNDEAPVALATRTTRSRAKPEAVSVVAPAVKVVGASRKRTAEAVEEATQPVAKKTRAAKKVEAAEPSQATVVPSKPKANGRRTRRKATPEAEASVEGQDVAPQEAPVAVSVDEVEEAMVVAANVQTPRGKATPEAEASVEEQDVASKEVEEAMETVADVQTPRGKARPEAEASVEERDVASKEAPVSVDEVEEAMVVAANIQTLAKLLAVPSTPGGMSMDEEMMEDDVASHFETPTFLRHQYERRTQEEVEDVSLASMEDEASLLLSPAMSMMHQLPSASCLRTLTVFDSNMASSQLGFTPMLPPALADLISLTPGGNVAQTPDSVRHLFNDSLTMTPAGALSSTPSGAFTPSSPLRFPMLPPQLTATPHPAPRVSRAAQSPAPFTINESADEDDGSDEQVEGSLKRRRGGGSDLSPTTVKQQRVLPPSASKENDDSIISELNAGEIASLNAGINFNGDTITATNSPSRRGRASQSPVKHHQAHLSSPVKHRRISQLAGPTPRRRVSENGLVSGDGDPSPLRPSEINRQQYLSSLVVESTTGPPKSSKEVNLRSSPRRTRQSFSGETNVASSQVTPRPTRKRAMTNASPRKLNLAGSTFSTLPANLSLGVPLGDNETLLETPEEEVEDEGVVTMTWGVQKKTHESIMEHPSTSVKSARKSSRKSVRFSQSPVRMMKAVTTPQSAIKDTPVELSPSKISLPMSPMISPSKIPWPMSSPILDGDISEYMEEKSESEEDEDWIEMKQNEIELAMDDLSDEEEVLEEVVEGFLDEMIATETIAGLLTSIRSGETSAEAESFADDANDATVMQDANIETEQSEDMEYVSVTIENPRTPDQQESSKVKVAENTEVNSFKADIYGSTMSTPEEPPSVVEKNLLPDHLTAMQYLTPRKDAPVRMPKHLAAMQVFSPVPLRKSARGVPEHLVAMELTPRKDALRTNAMPKHLASIALTPQRKRSATARGEENPLGAIFLTPRNDALKTESMPKHLAQMALTPRAEPYVVQSMPEHLSVMALTPRKDMPKVESMPKHLAQMKLTPRADPYSIKDMPGRPAGIDLSPVEAFIAADALPEHLAAMKNLSPQTGTPVAARRQHVFATNKPESRHSINILSDVDDATDASDSDANKDARARRNTFSGEIRMSAFKHSASKEEHPAAKRTRLSYLGTPPIVTEQDVLVEQDVITKEEADEETEQIALNDSFDGQKRANVEQQVVEAAQQSDSDGVSTPTTAGAASRNSVAGEEDILGGFIAKYAAKKAKQAEKDTFTPLHALPAIPELLSKTTTTDPILSKKEVKAAALSSPKKSKTSVSKSFKSKANTLAEPVPESLPTAPTTCGATAADSQALKRQSRVSALPVPAGRSRIPAPSRKVKTAAAATSISKTVSPPSQFDFTALTTPVSDELKLSQMTTREVANMTAKNTTKNAIFRTVTFEREVTQRTIPRPPSPDRKKRTAIARTLREQRELVEREKGIKLGAGDDLDFVPKVPSPTRKTVRWNEQLEVVFDGEDVKEPIAEPPSTLKSLLRQTIPAVQEEILDKLPIAQVKITKFLYKGEKD